MVSNNFFGQSFTLITSYHISNLPSGNRSGLIPQSSVGEVRSGLVPGHFFQTRDRIVQSLTKILGPGLGPPRTVYISLVLVQAWSRPGPCTFYLFIYSRSRTAGLCGMATQGRPLMGEDPDRWTSVSFPSMTRGAGSDRRGRQIAVAEHLKAFPMRPVPYTSCRAHSKTRGYHMHAS